MITADLMEALKSVEDKYGVKFAYKGARFESTTATFKIDGAILNSDGVAESKERKEFNTYSFMFNLPKEMLDKEVNYSGERYVVTGLNTRSQKYPVTAKRVSDGKGFKLTATGVLSAWNRQNQTPSTIQPITA